MFHRFCAKTKISSSFVQIWDLRPQQQKSSIMLGFNFASLYPQLFWFQKVQSLVCWFSIKCLRDTCDISKYQWPVLILSILVFCIICSVLHFCIIFLYIL